MSVASSHTDLISQLRSEILADLPEFREFLRLKAAGLISSHTTSRPIPQVVDAITDASEKHQPPAPDHARVSANETHARVSADDTHFRVSADDTPFRVFQIQSQHHRVLSRSVNARISAPLLFGHQGIDTPHFPNFYNSIHTDATRPSLPMQVMPDFPQGIQFGAYEGLHNTALNPERCATPSVAQHMGTNLPPPGFLYSHPSSGTGVPSFSLQERVEIPRPASKPVRKGDHLSVVIDDALHQHGVRENSHSLIGRRLFVAKEKPPTVTSLKSAFQDIWNLSSEWSLAPLGHGYFQIHIDNATERDKVFAARSWQSPFGTLRIQRWSTEFNPYKVKSSVVPVWIRIYELPVEYFYEPIIRSLASAIGSVLQVDERTRNRTLCHYARVLIEIDLKADREYTIMFERTGYCGIRDVLISILLDMRQTRATLFILNNLAAGPSRNPLLLQNRWHPILGLLLPLILAKYGFRNHTRSRLLPHLPLIYRWLFILHRLRRILFRFRSTSQLSLFRDTTFRVIHKTITSRMPLML